MIKINNFSIEKWSSQRCWFIRYPDGSGETISFSVSLHYIYARVLYLISIGIRSIFDLRFYSTLD